MRSSVLLPQPLGPRMVMKSFSATSRSVACSASVASKRRCTPRTERMVDINSSRHHAVAAGVLGCIQRAVGGRPPPARPPAALDQLGHADIEKAPVEGDTISSAELGPRKQPLVGPPES